MREFIAGRLDWLCAKLHWTEHIPVPMSWFDKDKYDGWRGRVCHFLYGHWLADLAFRIDPPESPALYHGTPWRQRPRPHPDDPYGDGMDDWGDPTDWPVREDWNDKAGRAAE